MKRLMNCGMMLMVAIAAADVCRAEQKSVVVTATNALQIARSAETLELDWTKLKKMLPTLHPRRVRVTEKTTGNPLLWQVIDSDGDGCPDQLLFQADYQPGETKTFVVAALPDWTPEPPSGVHCGYYDLHEVAREGKVTDEDDFAWENDRIAFRLYGPTTAKTFSGSGVDVWVKRVPYPILDKWHDSVKTFHVDRGEGGDFHTIGGTRGCGGVGIWHDGKLHLSGNYVSYQVLANGPIRALFEVCYAPWDAGGRKISERKRISIDLGRQLSRHEITFTSQDDKPIKYGIGLGKLEGSTVASGKLKNWVGAWGPVNTDPQLNGEFGLGIALADQGAEVLSTNEPCEFAKVPGHELILTQAMPGRPAVHYSGAAWSKWGGMKTAQDWFAYLDNFAQCLRSPLKISLKSGE